MRYEKKTQNTRTHESVHMKWAQCDKLADRRSHIPTSL